MQLNISKSETLACHTDAKCKKLYMVISLPSNELDFSSYIKITK